MNSMHEKILQCLWRAITCCMLLMVCNSAFAQMENHIQLIDTNKVLRLNPHFRILQEQNRELNIDEIRALKGSFNWPRDNNPNYGFSPRGLWLYTTFSNVTDVNDWIVDVTFAQLDKVDIYLFVDKTLIAYAKQGKIKTNQRFRFPTLEVELPFATEVEMYIRVQSANSSLIAPVDIQTAEKHDFQQIVDNLMWGLFYGGLLILAIYNLVLFFGYREYSLLAYVLYTCTVLIWQYVWGGHSQLFTPSGFTSWLSAHIDVIFCVIGIGSGIFTLFFLTAWNTAPRFFKLIIVSMITLMLMGVASGFSMLPPMWQSGLVYLFSLFAIVTYALAGFESYFNQFKPARYFIFAWSILASCAIIGMLSLTGVVPSNSFTTYCFQFGVFLEACLFSIALMDKSHGQLEAEIEQATDDLRNNMEIIEEQNARLDIARKDAIKASSIKSQFLANMSHEIRTPLNAILGFSNELSQLSLPSEKQEQVQIINSAAQNLLSIVNDVLDFSKIEAGKLQISAESFSPDELLEDVISVMAKSAHMKNLEFIYDISPLPEKLIGDDFRIKQILNNLLGNAIKFTHSGYVKIQAYGSLLEHGIYQLTIRVEDTGIGISQEDKKKLFSAFSQVEDALSRTYQGTGLGLVISQELAKLMRGSLSMRSTLGQGSSFTLSLKPNLLSAKSKLHTSNHCRGKEILLFDPYPHTRHTTAKLLKACGANVTSVESLAYLQYLRTHRQFDTMLATLPISKRNKREALLPALIEFPATQKFLLYSGADPFTQLPALSQYFLSQVRMPLTPRKLEQLASGNLMAQRPAQQVSLEQLPKARVLAVDDMEMNLRLLETWLSRSPLILTKAYNGEEALELCKQQEFDLILMDVQMPKMDGLQASQLIRKTSLNMGTPIIAVTAHAFKEEKERLLASGMDDYLPKPLDFDALAELIARWCMNAQHEPPQLPALDWQLAVKRANGNEDAARDMLRDFVRDLPEWILDIELAWDAQRTNDLAMHVHRLHGVSCYTGVPVLQALCNEVEGAIKRQQWGLIEQQMPNFHRQKVEILEQYERFSHH